MENQNQSHMENQERIEQNWKKQQVFERFLGEVVSGPFKGGYSDLKYVSETQQDYLFGNQWYRFTYNPDANKNRAGYVNPVSVETI